MTVWLSFMLRPPARAAMVVRPRLGRFFDVDGGFLGADVVAAVVDQLAHEVLLIVAGDPLVGLDDALGARLLQLVGLTALQLLAELVLCACHGSVLPRRAPLLRRMSGVDVP